MQCVFENNRIVARMGRNGGNKLSTSFHYYSWFENSCVFLFLFFETRLYRWGECLGLSKNPEILIKKRTRESERERTREAVITSAKSKVSLKCFIFTI